MSRDKPKSAAEKASTKASRQRKTTLEIPLPMIDAILDAAAGDLDQLEAKLYAVIYTRGIVENDYPNHLYAPGLRSLVDLPPAVLDTKEALPPVEMRFDHQRDLNTFLRRLVLIGGSEDDLDLGLITMGWPKVPSTGSDWLHHCSRIYRWRRLDGRIYKALVTGRFKPVIRYLRQLTIDNPDLAATLRRDLHVQALIWCAHDIQVVVARLAISQDTFGQMIKTAQRKLSPNGLSNKLVKRRAILESILDLLYRSPDWRERDLPPPELTGKSDDLITTDPLVQGLERRIELFAQSKGITIDAAAAEFADRLATIARRLRANATELAVSSPRGEKDAARRHSLAAFWYNGLPDVAAAAVPILRLVQAEQQMSAMIDALVPVKGVPRGARQGTALPPFDELGFPHGWRVRVSNLLHCYRALLDDPYKLIGGNAWPAINAARKFLKKRDQRMIGDDEGDRQDPKRTLYLLDVLPEHRFSAG